MSQIHPGQPLLALDDTPDPLARDAARKEQSFHALERRLLKWVEDRRAKVVVITLALVAVGLCGAFAARALADASPGDVVNVNVTYSIDGITNGVTWADVWLEVRACLSDGNCGSSGAATGNATSWSGSASVPIAITAAEAGQTFSVSATVKETCTGDAACVAGYSQSAGASADPGSVTVAAPPPSTTATTAGTTTTSTTTPQTTTVTVTTTVPAPAAPAPGDTTSTTTTVDQSAVNADLQSQIDALTAQIKALTEKTDRLAAASDAAWLAYEQALAAGDSPAIAAEIARGTGLNVIYGLGAYAA